MGTLLQSHAASRRAGDEGAEWAQEMQGWKADRPEPGK